MCVGGVAVCISRDGPIPKVNCVSGNSIVEDDHSVVNFIVE